jgi:hypothetical protein
LVEARLGLERVASGNPGTLAQKLLGANFEL